MSFALQKILLGVHQFAISAHNVQPFQFQFSENEVRIYVDAKRHLPAADPHEKDLRMSLGALFEAWNISLSEFGFALEMNQQFGESQNQQKPYAVFMLTQSEKKSELLPFQKKRFSFRGNFSKTQNKNLETVEKGLRESSLAVVTGEAEKKEIARLYNEMNLSSMLKKGYIEELYSWLRFNKSDAKYYQDGLNSDCLSLFGIEALGAKVVMHPKVFRALNKIGVAGALVDETSKIVSAPFLVGIVCEENLEDFSKGQIFYRKWLELTKLQLFGAPLSLLTDDQNILKKVCSLFQLKRGQTLANVIRCGPLPENFVRYQTARLPEAELIWRK